MALRVAPEVEAELDGMWSYVATESGDADVADRLINSMPTAVLCSPDIRIWAAAAITICAPACEVCLSQVMSSFTALRSAT